MNQSKGDLRRQRKLDYQRNYQKKQYNARKQAHECITCGVKLLPQHPYIYCSACLDRANKLKRKRQWNAKTTDEKWKYKPRNHHGVSEEEKKELIKKFSPKRKPSKTKNESMEMNQMYADKQAESKYQKKRYETLKSEHRCVGCGIYIPKNKRTGVYCSDCREKKKEVKLKMEMKMGMKLKKEPENESNGVNQMNQGKNELKNRKSKERYDMLKREHKCVSCRADLPEGHSGIFCRECHARTQKVMKKRKLKQERQRKRLFTGSIEEKRFAESIGLTTTLKTTTKPTIKTTTDTKPKAVTQENQALNLSELELGFAFGVLYSKGRFKNVLGMLEGMDK